MLRKALFVIRQSRTRPLALSSALDLLKSLPGDAQKVTLAGIAILDLQAMRERMAQKVLGYTMSYSPALREVERTVREEFDLLIKEFKQACSAAGVRHDAQLREGSLPAVLKSEAEAYDLLVVPRDTDEGDSSVQRLLNPRLFPEILSECPTPTLLGPLLPSAASLAPPAPVVVAYDGSDGAVRALHSAAMLGFVDGRDVEVVSVHASEDAARSCAEKAAALVTDHGGRLKLVPRGTSQHPAEVLLDHLGHRPALLVMGAFGARSIKELLFGAVTEQVVDRCPCPILLQR